MTADLSTARAWVERRPLLADAALALLVFAVSLQPLFRDPGCVCPPQPPWAYALVAAQCLPLVWRRRWPFTAGVAAGLLTALHGLTSVPEPAVAFAGLVAVYSVAAHASRRVALLSGGLAAVVIAVTMVLDAPRADAQDLTVNSLIFATAWLLGDGVRTRRERAAELEARIVQGEQLRAVEADRALADERARIARELHDVVAHALGAMTVQAAAARRLAEKDTERAGSAFQAVEATGREALTELRRLLGVLRRADAELALAPQPRLAFLNELAQRMAAAGLAVRGDVQGEVPPLPVGVDLTAYRVVQEALGEALRTGGAGLATVHVRHRGGEIEVEVVDDGRNTDRRLLGMRERVRVYGGQLEIAPRREGGHRVRARLPVGAAA